MIEGTFFIYLLFYIRSKLLYTVQYVSNINCIQLYKKKPFFERQAHCHMFGAFNLLISEFFENFAACLVN
jgi:hypothetical protein